jgi:hypothetical protein
MKVIAVSLFLCANVLMTLAQSSYTGGVLLEIKPSLSFENDWKLRSKFGSRFLFFEGSDSQSFTPLADFERAELEFVLTKKVSPATSLGGGYLTRLQKGIVKHRLIQQFSISNERETFSLEHRFRFDETFQVNKANIYRFRYRFSFEKSLNQEVKKDKKTYFILYNEYIPSVQSGKYQMEIRILPGLGFKLNKDNKLEVGVDYRVEKLFTSTNKQIYLLYCSWSPQF